MSTSDDSSSSLSSSETNANPRREYYEEVGYKTLDLQKRKVPASKSVAKSVTQEPPSTPINPIQKLNAQLNRQFRPDLVPPSPSPSLLPPETVSKRIPIPNPVIFDARAKPVKLTKKEKEEEPSTSVKDTLFNRVHQLIKPTTQPNPPYNIDMSNIQTSVNGFQVPPGMMLVPAPQQQIQPQPTVSQYKPPTITHSNSFKHNKVAPPPSAHKTNHALVNNSYITPSSMVSTNHFLQSSYPQQQQNAFKHIEPSKPNKKKSKKQSDNEPSNAKNPNKAFALYNQQNGRIEGVVQNRLHIANDDIDESRILDDDTEPKTKWMAWLSQPLCLGLTRLSGIVLFGSMGLLGCAAIAGLIASIVTYSQDSSTDAQWKILGMVVSAIMLITIIITLLIFICCYKHGYMFDKDDDVGLVDSSGANDPEGPDGQKAFLRKIYKFNRPNETPPVPSTIPQDVKTPPPPPQPTIYVNDKQTNTDTTIAEAIPRDFNRGVWPSVNAYGGISRRPLIVPYVSTRYVQVFPHEIDEATRPQQIIYKVVAPTAAMSPSPVHTRMIQIPASQAPVVEVIETVPKAPRTIHITASQVPGVEVIETVQKTPRTIRVPASEAPIVEYVDAAPKQARTTIVRQPQTQQIIVQPNTRIEYVDVDEQQGRRRAQQPQYEIVEEVVDRSTASPTEEFVEYVEMPRHGRRHAKKKDGKRSGYGKVLVKHVKGSHD